MSINRLLVVHMFDSLHYQASDDSDDEHLQSLLAKENVTAAQMHTNLGSRGLAYSFRSG